MEHEKTQAAPPRKTGRPQLFDRGVALEKAMLTFWRYASCGRPQSLGVAPRWPTPSARMHAHGDHTGLLPKLKFRVFP